MITVQIIEIIWTHASHTAPEAMQRSRLPRGFSLARPVTKYVCQHLRLDEANNFDPVQISLRTAASIPQQEQSLVLANLRFDAIELGLNWRSADGQPARSPVPNALRIKRDEFARLAINGRHVSYCEQYYSEKIFNVAYGENFDPDTFLAAKPTHHFEQFAKLF